MKTNIDEYNEIISECRRFAQKEIQPSAIEMDLQPECEWLRTIWEKSRLLDLPLLLIPQSNNGAGYPEKCAALVLDIIAMECAGVASLFTGHFAVCAALTGGEKQDNELPAGIKKIIDTDPLPVFSVILSYDPDDALLEFKRINGKYILNGQSCLVLSAMVADYFLVLFQNSEDTDSHDCICIPKLITLL